MASNASDYFLSDHAANESGYRSKKANIPFYTEETNEIKVKLKYDQFSGDTQAERNQSFRDKLSGIKTRATNRILLHYFPEYYIYYRTLVRKKPAAYGSGSPQEDAYRRVRDCIRDNLSAAYYRPHDPILRLTKDMVLVTFSSFGFQLSRPDVEKLKLKVGPSSVVYQKVQGFRIPAENENITFKTRSPKELKAVLAALGLIPSRDEVEGSLNLFNEDEGITRGTDHTTLKIGSLMQDSALAQDSLGAYQEQLNGFEGSIPINLNFNDMQRGMMQILNGVVIENVLKELTDVTHAGSLTVGGPYIDFAEADSIILSFGKREETGKTAISAINYVVASVSPTRKPLMIGYITSVLYNKEFNDPLILATLKDYEMLVNAMKLANNFSGPSSSFMDWLKSGPEGNTIASQLGAPENFVWDDIAAPPAPPPTDHILLREAYKLGIIDLSDVKDLEKGFATAMSPEQLERFKREVYDNPEVYAKVRASVKKKVIGTAVDVTAKISEVLESGGPLGLMAGVKPDSPLGQLLRKIGVQELAKEAWICATFGVAPAFARITRAAGSAIAKGGSMGSQFPRPPARLGPPVVGKHKPPPPPKPSITIPKPKPPKIQTNEGDPFKGLWKQLQKVLIDTLIQACFEIIKGLAQLLKEACKLNNPRSDDYGATDVGDLVNNNLNDNIRNVPSISNDSALDQLFGNDGLTSDQILGGPQTAGYLTELSEILSSMEICFLFSNRSELSSETIDRIINYNLSYPDLQVRAALNTPSAVLGFFANLARFVDVTEFCNQIANELFQANIDNICLLEDAAPDRIADLLLDMAENGLQLDNPVDGLNLGCPDREGFVDNPLVNTAIPTLMNTVADVVEREFVNGVSAAQQILKEPNITQSESSRIIAQSIHAAGAGAAGGANSVAPAADPPLDPISKKISADILKGMKNAFNELGSLLERLGEFCDLGAILGVEADMVEEVIGTIINVMREMLNDPEFLNAIAGLDKRLSDIAAALEEPGEGNGIATQYQFPASFLEQFETYLSETPIFNPIPNMTTQDYRTFMTNGHVKSKHFNAYSSYSNYDSYKPITMRFTFPRKEEPRLIPDPAGAMQPLPGTATTANPAGVPNRFGIPKFVRAPTPAGGNNDSLTITFPDADTAAKGENFVNVTLKSKLLPTPGGPNNFSLRSEVPSITNNRNTNPYVSLFSDNLIRQMNMNNLQTGLLPGFQAGGDNYDSALRQRYIREFDTVLFPAVFAGQVEAMFNFIQHNGIFDTEKLDSLNFFHDNASCLPENVADLMDMGPTGPGAGGKGKAILDEIKDEMNEALCQDAPAADDDNPQGTQIRDVLRFGVFEMLIQLHIAQFVIKNIFVFSAFEIDDLLNLPTVKQFMSVTIRNQIMTLLRAKPLVGEKIVQYYNKKLRRSSTSGQGGLLDSNGEVVFPAGTTLMLGDLSALIEYATEERIFNSRRSVSNAVKRSSNKTNPKDFDRAFIEDVLTLQPSFLGAGVAGSGPRQEIVVPANPNLQNSAGKSWRAYSVGNPGSPGPTAIRERYREIARNKFKYDTALAKVFRYGKLVLERQVVWDHVHNEDGKPIPGIIAHHTGTDFGLELSIFQAALFDGDVRRATFGSGTSRKLKFKNLAMRYNIVYYMPDDQMTNPQVMNSAAMFYEQNSLGNHIWLPLGGDENITLNRFVLARLDGSLPLAGEISTTEKAASTRYNTTLGRWATTQVPVLQTQLEAYRDKVTNSELTLITEDGIFQDYFDKVFNRSLTSLVPIMYNFYLITESFPAMDGLLMGAKLRCLDIIIDSVLNEDPSTPSVAPYASAQAAEAALTNINDPLSGINQSARDFILKMLIETPINILRGVSETMDPHVGISKIIRDITAMIFNEMAKAIDKSEPVRFLREGPLPPEQAAAPPPEPPGGGGIDASAALPPPAPAPQAPGLPIGAGLYKLRTSVPPSPDSFDEAYVYARLPMEPAGSPPKWYMKKITDETWIDISDNSTKVIDCEKNCVAYTPSEATLFREGQGGVVVRYTLDPSNSIRLRDHRISVAAFEYAKDAQGDWLYRQVGTNRAWATAYNISHQARSGVEWAIATVATLESKAVPVGGAPVEVDPTATEGTGGAATQAELDANIAAAATAIGELPIETVLRKGNEGQNVRILQAKLEQLEYMLVQFGIDGIFGSETEGQVKAFQTASQIEVDGIVGPDTWAALVAALTALAAAQPPTAPDPTSAPPGTPTQGSPLGLPVPTPGVGPFPDVTGEKIMELLFCVLAISMEAASSGFILGPGSPNGKDRKGQPMDTTMRLPSLDWKNFVGEGSMPKPKNFAMFIGNPPKVPFSSPQNLPLMPEWDGLTYVRSQEDPRDPRNNIPQALKDNLFPRINMDGVDFTGTFLGLLMMPPGPFGIVYLLLMLLKNALDDAMKSDQSAEDDQPISNLSEEETASQC